MDRENEKPERRRLWVSSDGRLRVAKESELPGQDPDDPSWLPVSYEDILDWVE